MEPPVRVVVSCSERKSLPIPPDLRLAGYADDLSARATSWIERIEHPTGETVTARQLYQGEHWSVARRLPETDIDSGCNIELWVASAGYGLVHIDDQLEPYAATFAPRNADSITRPDSGSSPSSDAADWWRRLSERNRPSGRPESLRSLARQVPHAPLVVALSGSYARAVTRDLMNAAQELHDPGKLFLIANGLTGPELQSYRVPANAKFQQSLGGTRMSLNVRVAKRLIELAPSHRWDPTVARMKMAEELAALDAVPRFDRKPMSDSEVVDFIKHTFDTLGRLPQTKILRQLRDQNKACEQKRFARLYLNAVEGAR